MFVLVRMLILSTIKIIIRSGRIQVISSRLAISVDLTPSVALIFSVVTISSAATTLSIATLSIATPSTATPSTVIPYSIR